MALDTTIPFIMPPAHPSQGLPMHLKVFLICLLVILLLCNIPHSPHLSLQSFPKKGSNAPVRTIQLTLSSGLEMVCLQAGPKPKFTPKNQPFVLFVHGSMHGAWCWAEHWMPYLAARKVASIAVNLRGTSGALLPVDYNEGKKTIQLSEYVQDLSEVVQYFAMSTKRPILIVGHSFGGLMVTKLMENPDIQALMQPDLHSTAGRLAGLVLLCSVPPSGNSGLIKRSFWKQPILTIKIAYGFAANALMTSVPIAKAVLFDDAMSDATIEGYMVHFRQDGQYRLRLPDHDLPAVIANVSNKGIASWVGGAGLHPSRILVIGGGKDALVDTVAVQETAAFCGTQAEVLPGVCHDPMLDSQRWELGVSLLYNWLKTLN